MGGTKKQNPQNKAWEKQRRERLNEAFDNLAKKLPDYSASWSKIEILQKSLEYIINSDNEWKRKSLEQEERLKEMISKNDQLLKQLRDSEHKVPAINSTRPKKKTAKLQRKKGKATNKKLPPIKIKLTSKTRHPRVAKHKSEVRVRTEEIRYSETKILTRQQRLMVDSSMEVQKSVSQIVVATTNTAISALTSNVNVTPSPFLTTPIMTTGIFISHNNRLLSVPVVPVHQIVTFAPPAAVAPLKKRGRKSKKQLNLTNFYQQSNVGKVAIPALKRNRVVVVKKRRKRKVEPSETTAEVSEVKKAKEDAADPPAIAEVSNKENIGDQVVIAEKLDEKPTEPKEIPPQVADDMSSDEDNMESEMSLNLSQTDDLLFASESLSPTAKYLMTFPLVARAVESTGKIGAVEDSDEDEIIRQEITLQADKESKEKVSKDELLNLENLTSFFTSDVLDAPSVAPTSKEERVEKQMAKEHPSAVSTSASTLTLVPEIKAATQKEVVVTSIPVVTHSNEQYFYNSTMDMVPLPLTPTIYPVYSSRSSASAHTPSKTNTFDYNFRSMSKNTKISESFPNFTFALTTTANQVTTSTSYHKNFSQFEKTLAKTSASCTVPLSTNYATTFTYSSESFTNALSTGGTKTSTQTQMKSEKTTTSQPVSSLSSIYSGHFLHKDSKTNSDLNTPFTTQSPSLTTHKMVTAPPRMTYDTNFDYFSQNIPKLSSTPMPSILNNYAYNNVEKSVDNLAAFTFSLTSSTNTVTSSKSQYSVTSKLPTDLVPKSMQLYYGIPDDMDKMATVPFSFSLTTSTEAGPKPVGAGQPRKQEAVKSKKPLPRENVRKSTESSTKMKSMDQTLKTPTKSNVYAAATTYPKHLKSGQGSYDQNQMASHMPSSIYDVNWLTSEQPIIPPLDFSQSTTVQPGNNTVVAANFYPPVLDSYDNTIYSNRKSDVYFAHPPEDTWSPNKITNLLDTTSNTYFTPTLPNLHGDLALNTLPAKTNHQNKAQNATEYKSSCALFPQKSRETKPKDGSKVSNNPLFSVRQLVESTKNFQDSPDAQNLAMCKKPDEFRKAGGDRSHYFPPNDVSCNYQIPTSACKQATIPTSYSAESLIATKKDQQKVPKTTFSYKNDMFDQTTSATNYSGYDSFNQSDQNNYYAGNNFKYYNQNFLSTNFGDAPPPPPVTMFSNEPANSSNFQHPYKNFMEDFVPPPPVFLADKKGASALSKPPTGKSSKKVTKEPSSKTFHHATHHTSALLNYDYAPLSAAPSFIPGDDSYNFHNYNFSTTNAGKEPLNSNVDITYQTGLNMQPNNESMVNSNNALANFNLSTICPEINDKVRQQNWG